ncbi:hypothetical protein BUE93_01045 [Chromobacterium amazonense]|uniref:DUF4243 domain-containing protein n=1 Tax=Chromobacterium amazonense TaxID=1382803 RepID=A0A2S9XA84_9NEIS|nr:hypothetical protein [Chromobacterium amazonense]PRP72648.1 hypothetical protein BUE93_01045 [Chromobacterium amazonense]
MLSDMLTELLPYSGSYRGGLSNHLPMTLQALAELGASDAELRLLAARRSHLEPLPDHGRDIGDTRGWLGDAQSEGAWRRRFACERGRGEWGRHWPSRLQLVLAAPASASFHGVIRLAYALRGGVEPEIDAALAYALSHWRLLPLPGLASAPQGLGEVLRNWQAAPLPIPDDGRLISDEIAAALALPDVPQRLPPGLLASAREQRLYARLLFQARHEFDALHLLTGWEAALSLARGHGMSEVPDSAALQMQAALLGIYIYNGCPVLARPGKMALADVGEIAAQARSQADDHSIKLALSCLRLAELEDDADWLMLAAQTARRGWRGVARA